MQNNNPRPWNKLLSANSTTATFTAPAATVTNPPVSSGAISPIDGETLELMPFGAGADTNTFDLYVIGWSKINTLWVPKILAQLACTLTVSVGVSGASVVDTDRFCDSIVATKGTVVIPTSVADTPLSAIIDITGWQYLSILTNRGSSATNANTLWKIYGKAE